MSVHGVRPHPSLGNPVPLSTASLPPKAQEKSPSEETAASGSYSQFDKPSSNGANGDAIDRDAALAGGHEASQPVPDPAANANPVTQQAPDAEALVGVGTYNFRGQIAPLHPGAGNSLRLSA